MNNEKRWDGLIKKAVEKEIESYPSANSERIWQRIEHTIGMVDDSQKIITRQVKRKLWLKIAAAFSVFIFLFTLATFTPAGEALPFGHVFQNFKKLVFDDQIHIQFSYGEDPTPKPGEPFPEHEMGPEMEPGIIESGPAHDTFIETTLEELLDIYPKTLYYPQNIPVSALNKVEYLGPLEHCNILMDFSIENQDIMLRQRYAGERGSVGMAFGADAEVTLHRIDGVEYMVVEHRYGLVGVKWMKDGYYFDLDGNLTVEDALLIAQSVQPYLPRQARDITKFSERICLTRWIPSWILSSSSSLRRPEHWSGPEPLMYSLLTDISPSDL